MVLFSTRARSLNHERSEPFEREWNSSFYHIQCVQKVYKHPNENLKHNLKKI
jgi:hypothetical protein